MKSLTKILEEEYGTVKADRISPIHISSNENVQKLLNAYDTWLSEGANYSHSLSVHKILSTQAITSEDITAFCFGLSLFEERSIFKLTGKFLSELVNQHFMKTQTERYLLVTKHLIKPISYLGEETNGADIFIDGPGGNVCCQNMHTGTVSFTGDVQDRLGYGMMGGTIIVEKNARDEVGAEILDGLIIVKGSSRNRVARYGKRGNIYIGTDASIPYGEDLVDGRIRVYCRENQIEFAKEKGVLFNGQIFDIKKYETTYHHSIDFRCDDRPNLGVNVYYGADEMIWMEEINKKNRTNI